MTAAFPHVFEPLRLRHRTLRSRITFGAHTANMAEGGLPGERHIGYYRERALGGAGMIVVEPCRSTARRVLTRGNFRHRRRCRDPGLPARHRRLPRGEPGRRAHPPAVPRRPARRRRQLVRAQLVAVGSAVVPRRRRQPRDDRGRDRRADRWLRRGGRRAQASRLRRRRGLRRVPRGRRPVLGAVVEPADGRRGAGRSSAGCASRPRSSGGIREACGEDFIVGLAVSVDPGRRGDAVGRRAGGGRRLARRAAADGLRHLRHGLVLRLPPDHAAVAVRRSASASRSRQP